jgi:glucoamylase
MDEVAAPVILAWMLHRTDAATYTGHVKPAADYLVANGPATQAGPLGEPGRVLTRTIAAQIAGLVCAADIAKANFQPRRTGLRISLMWSANYAA